MKRIRIGVLASGGGTNLQSIIDSCEREEIDGEVVVVISNVPEASALERARKHGIDAFAFPHKNLTREQHEADIIECLEQHRVDLVCLAGYLRVLTPLLVNKYAGRLMNTHPALLPSFGGVGMHGLNVHKAVLDYGCKVSGCTIHFVTLDVDGGPIILQKSVPVQENDSPEILQERILKEEHKLFLRAIELFAKGKLKIDGRRVRILET
ncbi:MAG: phosphoribosylglycinamide formyltransferase [Euryarchaeota archaeon RBG_13_61_15]|jgi:phosphoribosylglycinamide formyltransferase-1|nr:MAG: phosphoribosylglycinamide formyltransferase [Euryarchaeota archaeon RBG_13_61_15]